MVKIAKLVGGAGTGKTTELLRIMAKVAETGVDPLHIGFVSFTRAARAEAAERAADLFDVPVSLLERDGWFRTLHSVCYRLLRVSSEQLITSDAKSREWLENALQARLDARSSIDEIAEQAFVGKTDAANALNLWSAARARLERFEPTWAEANRCDDRTPSYDRCVEIIERYEHHKRLDNKLDFTDLLLRFAGYRLSVEGAERVEPEGEWDDLPRYWFFDEQQDASALLHAVCERLIENAVGAYLVGDPFQSIYGWAGADHRFFLNFDAAQQRTMPRSYRCPAIISRLGERILRECSDYYDRGISPAEHDGTIERAFGLTLLGSFLRAEDDWLLLARTNQQAARIVACVESHSMPWQPTKGAGGFLAPAKQELLDALDALRGGGELTPAHVKRLVQLTPTKHGDAELLKRGAKSRFAEEGLRDGDRGRLRDVVEREKLLEDIGFTPRFFELIWSGQVGCYKDFAKFWKAYERYGPELVRKPMLRIGTVHSVKGAEAENVAVLTTVSQPVVLAQSSRRGFDEERRVEYVAVTRARRRLVIVDEVNRKQRMRLEA